jgi:type IV fimbrial biogenesis protein FimT
MRETTLTSGFTMMEMVILMAVIAILAALALPNASNYIDNNRLNAAAADMVVTMQTARSEAVGRNVAVTICAATGTGTACRPDGHRWELGWLMFVDSDADRKVDGGEEVIQYHQALNKNLTLRGSSEINKPITFFPSGRTSITSTQTMILCDSRGFGEHAKGLVVSILGRASVTKATDMGKTACILF